MTLDNLQTALDAVKTVAPLISSASDLLARMLSGVVSTSVARAEMRSICVVGLSRLDAAELEDVQRDARHDARVGGRACGFGGACVLPLGHVGEHSETKP